jgi:hypothetical protein
MTTIRRPLGLSSAILALAACPPTWADSGSSIIRAVDPAVIEVRSNGTTYEGVLPQVQLKGQAEVAFDAQISGRVKSWSVWLVAEPMDPTFWNMSFHEHKKTTTYDALNRPKSVSTKTWVAIPHQITRNWAVNTCITMASRLRNEGLSDAQIFGQDREIPYRVKAWHSFETTGIAGAQTPQEVTGVEMAPNFRLVCKASPKNDLALNTHADGPERTHGPALLKAVSISVQAPASPVQCPANATAFFTFRSDGSKRPGYVNYRVRGASGKNSQVMTITFRESDREGTDYVRTVVQHFTVGQPPAPAATTPGGPARGRQSGDNNLTSATPPNPDDGVIPGPRGAAGRAVDGAYAAPGGPTPSNVHQDSLWIDVTAAAAGSVMKSDFAAYSVTCAPRTSGVGAGGLEAVPGTPPGTQHPPSHPGGKSGGPQQPTPLPGRPGAATGMVETPTAAPPAGGRPGFPSGPATAAGARAVRTLP